MQNNRDEINVLVQREKLTEIETFLEERMESMGLSMKLMNKVQVSADEIFSNIVNYSGAAECRISLKKKGTDLELKFEDNGKAFDPTNSENPDVTLSAEERKIGGLGIFMVRKMTSSMNYEYRAGWNFLTLTFATEQEGANER